VPAPQRVAAAGALVLARGPPAHDKLYCNEGPRGRSRECRAVWWSEREIPTVEAIEVKCKGNISVYAANGMLCGVRIPPVRLRL
jgi:hypothetical protein